METKPQPDASTPVLHVKLEIFLTGGTNYFKYVFKNNHKSWCNYTLKHLKQLKNSSLNKYFTHAEALAPKTWLGLTILRTPR